MSNCALGMFVEGLGISVGGAKRRARPCVSRLCPCFPTAVQALTLWSHLARGGEQSPTKRKFLFDNLLVRIHFIIVMMRWTGLTQREGQFPFPGSLSSTILASPRNTLSATGRSHNWFVRNFTPETQPAREAFIERIQL